MSAHANQIREHMSVVGNDGQNVGTVDRVEGDRIKLTKGDDQQHHYLPLQSVQGVSGQQVQLNCSAQEARQSASGETKQRQQQ
ncbi:DUF2171 domain-containing protein [Roseomonas sp. CECT 9278]|uniref:DUF2171 domain-containing protein n=1 Tax=Roseomonas sp. CECT 9278 TaxID=2845823 RepID=UPI001E3D210B|nr:DUF2171 domain-containing protein [Roseomonas sp. CECT 9278]CAH0184941.1 hypothetical protein ROS9278_01537 [Roseomonas sp. CECT 9278]